MCNVLERRNTVEYGNRWTTISRVIDDVMCWKHCIRTYCNPLRQSNRVNVQIQIQTAAELPHGSFYYIPVGYANFDERKFFERIKLRTQVRCITNFELGRVEHLQRLFCAILGSCAVQPLAQQLLEKCFPDWSFLGL